MSCSSRRGTGRRACRRARIEGAWPFGRSALSSSETRARYSRTASTRPSSATSSRPPPWFVSGSAPSAIAAGQLRAHVHGIREVLGGVAHPAADRGRRSHRSVAGRAMARRPGPALHRRRADPGRAGDGPALVTRDDPHASQRVPRLPRRAGLPCRTPTTRGTSWRSRPNTFKSSRIGSRKSCPALPFALDDVE